MSIFKIVRQIIAISIGAAIMGLGVNLFNIPNELASGGFAGIAILLKWMIGTSPALVLLIVNIPLLIWGFIDFGWRSMLLTLYGTLNFTFFLWVFDGFTMPLGDPLLAALYAGVASGAGLGLVLRSGGTTGGMDIIARLLGKYFGISFGQTMLYADIMVLSLSLIHLDPKQVMYTLVAVFIGSRVVDTVQQGAYRGKALMIVSEKSQAIAEGIIEQAHRGVTVLKGLGAYSKKRKRVLYTVCGQYELVRVRRLIDEIDPEAFVTITNVHEVMGLGFSRAMPPQQPPELAIQKLTRFRKFKKLKRDELALKP